MVVDVRQDNGKTISTMVVKQVAMRHTGQYQCAPSNANKTSITVHILKGKVEHMFKISYIIKTNVLGKNVFSKLTSLWLLMLFHQSCYMLNQKLELIFLKL